MPRSPEKDAMERAQDVQRLEVTEKRRGARVTWGFELVIQIVLGILLTVVVAWLAK
jgi:hypothetical protein